MSTEIRFQLLLDSIALVDKRVGSSRLVIADKPHPFVPPRLLAETVAAPPFGAEVVFVEAPAAVGKSTMARFLSAARNAPLLDLAKVPVATGSLKSLISDLPGAMPIEAFHEGTLPLIVDALDEGQLLSGEKGFEAFLQTTGELLLSDRRVTRRPKIIILGRPASVDLARLGLELSGEGLTMLSVKVGFFDKSAAYDMIDAYALSVATPSGAYERNPAPVRALINAYFSAIEAALGLNEGRLWSDRMGRAFAGYAPVLSALGLLLAKVDNFLEIENRGQRGSQWALRGTSG